MNCCTESALSLRRASEQRDASYCWSGVIRYRGLSA